MDPGFRSTFWQEGKDEHRKGRREYSLWQEPSFPTQVAFPSGTPALKSERANSKILPGRPVSPTPWLCLLFSALMPLCYLRSVIFNNTPAAAAFLFCLIGTSWQQLPRVSPCSLSHRLPAQNWRWTWSWALLVLSTMIFTPKRWKLPSTEIHHPHLPPHDLVSSTSRPSSGFSEAWDSFYRMKKNCQNRCCCSPTAILLCKDHRIQLIICFYDILLLRLVWILQIVHCFGKSLLDLIKAGHGHRNKQRNNGSRCKMQFHLCGSVSGTNFKAIEKERLNTVKSRKVLKRKYLGKGTFVNMLEETNIFLPAHLSFPFPFLHADMYRQTNKS